MKTVLVTTLLLALVNTASAQYVKKMETVEHKTLFTCQQTDGDVWYEAGLVKDAEGYHKLLLVKHDADNNSVSLLYDMYGSVEQTNKSIAFTAYSDWADFRLTVTNNGKSPKGSFVFGETGDKALLQDDNMECYENSTISYEIEAGLEPRMSVGN